jgi:hypothetical protein
MRPARRAALLPWLVMAALAGGCSTQLPEPPAGLVIRGEVRYQGQAHLGYTRPAIQVLAFARLPASADDRTRPHALVVLEPASYDAPIAYVLGPLPPFRYKVLARVFDLANLDIHYTQLPSGGYPDACKVLEGPTGNVEVTEAAPTTGIDITMYDRGGTTDPCNMQATEVCPQPGTGSLVARLLLDRPIAQVVAPDKLLFAVLKNATDLLPVRFRLLEAPDVAQAGGFPYRVVFNNVPPDSYLAYGCYDVGGDNITSGACGPMDFATPYMNMGRLDIAAGTITTIELDLGRNTSALTGVEPAAARGCP